MDTTVTVDNPKRPISIVVVLCWYVYSALYAIVKSFNLHVVLFSTAVTGASALAYFFVQFAIPAAIFWAIFKRRLWGANLALVWQGLSLAIAVANYLWFLQHRAETLMAFTALRDTSDSVPLTPGLVHAAIGFSSAFAVIVSVLVIICLMRRRDYFRR